MKYLLSLLAGISLWHVASAESFVVHEWGTFTSVSGSHGVLLPGLEREEHALPAFVHSHAGFSPANKGWDRPVANVTIKMETPVIYFYADTPRSVELEVKFHGGSISQWYPERSGGETLPSDFAVPPRVNVSKTPALPPIDFAPGYRGSASWRVDILAPQAPDKLSARKDWETPQWPRARVPDANKVRGLKGETEGFIFYRGIGNFPLPLTTQCEGGNLSLRNRGAGAIPYLFVYEKSASFPTGVVWWSGALEAGTQKAVPLLKSSGDLSATPILEKDFPRALQRAGLSENEARAMIATWRESYFEREGLRVFWIVPRAFTDSVLPISISPQPDRLERVLVGRSEVLTPAFEKGLSKEFAADRGQRWMSDRYYLAYLARARQLGVVLPAARP
jgi:hypothetical protein